MGNRALAYCTSHNPFPGTHTGPGIHSYGPIASLSRHMDPETVLVDSLTISLWDLYGFVWVSYGHRAIRGYEFTTLFYEVMFPWGFRRVPARVPRVHHSLRPLRCPIRHWTLKSQRGRVGTVRCPHGRCDFIGNCAVVSSRRAPVVCYGPKIT